MNALANNLRSWPFSATLFLAAATIAATTALSQEASPTPEPPEVVQAPVLIAKDKNGDGAVKLLFFGDSLTYGIGGSFSPGDEVESLGESEEPPDGYPSKFAALSGLLSENAGDPGEVLTDAGILRFPSVVGNSNADMVGIFEGVNDARSNISREAVRRATQRLINVATALGKDVILFTLFPPCCDHDDQAAATPGYSAEVRDLAAINELPVVDLERLWRTSCPTPESCGFLNIPEGLHPNRRGYEAIAQVLTGVVNSIDLFLPSGATDFESAFQLPAGSVLVKPGS